MAKTYNEFKDEVRSDLLGPYNTSVNTAKQNAQTQKNTINTNADTAIKSAEEYYGKQEADTRADYEDKFQSNEVQRVLNERYISRKAAEMGLTDSGLNRTQQTAVQLSYANQKGDLEQQRQKAIDTLAAALTAEKTEINTQRNNKLSEIETTLNTNLANLKSGFENDVITNANARWNTYLEDLRKKEEAYLEDLRKKEEAKQKEVEQKNNDLNKLYTHLQSNNDDAEYSAKLITEYAYKYDIDENGSEIEILLRAAKISRDVYENYCKTRKIYASPTEYAANNSYMVKEWDYKTAGKQTYQIKIDKATNNWGEVLGYSPIDRNDRVTIYYPDGTVLAENIPLKAFTKANGQKLTDLTAGKTKGNTKYSLELDLSKENLSNYISKEE